MHLWSKNKFNDFYHSCVTVSQSRVGTAWPHPFHHLHYITHQTQVVLLLFWLSSMSLCWSTSSPQETWRRYRVYTTFLPKEEPPPPQFPHLSPVNYFQWTTESPQPYLLNLPSAHTHTHLPGYISAVQYDWNIIFNNGKRQKGFLGGPPRYEREEARVQS